MISSLNQVCRQCRGLFEHAAHLLTSESEDGNISDDVAIEFTQEHHSILIANNNAKSCHMCSLIAHVFPHILDAYDPHSPIQWVMWGDKDDQLLDLGFQIRKYDFTQDLRIQISMESLYPRPTQRWRLTHLRCQSSRELASYPNYLVF